MMGDLVTVTEADLLKLAPKAKREYVTAILGSLSQMRAAGILENEYRWCHFISQCAHETGGFTIIRESLTYTSAKRLRTVWPARFRDKSDAELAPLLKNPVALGDAVYMGRMGNVAPGDGYKYRGAGALQTTGRSAVEKYARACGFDANPELLDDCSVTMQFAIVEWGQAHCNEHADANDILAVSRAINVGSASSGVTPVGLDGRKECFAKAWGIWGLKGKPDTTKPPKTLKEIAGKIGLPAGGTGVAGGALLGGGVPKVPEVATNSLQNVTAWRGIGSGVKQLGTEVVGVFMMTGRLWPYALGASVGAAGLAFLWWKKRGEDETA